MDAKGDLELGWDAARDGLPEDVNQSDDWRRAWTLWHKRQTVRSRRNNYVRFPSMTRKRAGITPYAGNLGRNTA